MINPGKPGISAFLHTIQTHSQYFPITNAGKGRLFQAFQEVPADAAACRGKQTRRLYKQTAAILQQPSLSQGDQS